MSPSEKSVLQVALKAIRSANDTASMMQQNEFLLGADEAAKEISFIRIELSAASAQMAQLVDDVFATKRDECDGCGAELSTENTIVRADGSHVCRNCQNAWNQKLAEIGGKR